MVEAEKGKQTRKLTIVKVATTAPCEGSHYYHHGL